MGLAASQAKLLSITTRLSDNELRSQTLTAAKMALSNQTSAASKKYINALNSTELLYGTYDMNGNKTTVALTGTALSEYAPLKNQYGLVNTKGQILVSERDAEYYKKSSNLVEFLKFYGYDNGFKEEVYDEIDYGTYKSDLADYNKWHDDWLKREPKQDDYGEYTSEWVHNGVEPNPNNPKYWIDDPNWVAPPVDPEGGENTWSLYEAFMEGTAGGCFSCSSNPSSTEYNVCRHYIHTLAHMLVNGATDISEDAYIWWTTPDGGVNGTSGDIKIMSQIANALVGKTACGESDPCTESHDHEFYGTEVHFDCGDEECDGEELITDKIRNLIGDIDSFARSKVGGGWGGTYKAEDDDPEWIALKQRYYHLIEHDLKGVLENVTIPKEEPKPDKIFDEETYNDDWNKWNEDLSEVVTFIPDEDAFNEAHDRWLEEYQEPPNIEDYKQTLTRVTQELESNEGEWYINLWHRMNGASNYKVTLDGVDNGVHSSNSNGVVDGDNITSPGNGKTPNGAVLWAVLEDGLMNSSKWLQNALNQGTVTLEQVQFTGERTESNTGLENVSWKSIIYTSAQDITEQTDETAIAKAEAEYERAQNDIEAKDKQFDNMLKLLDTEHEALQTEYESVQQVINKNISRTLKIYSA